jgi:hypothetical protein
MSTEKAPAGEDNYILLPTLGKAFPRSTHPSLACSPKRFLSGTQKLLFLQVLLKSGFVPRLYKPLSKKMLLNNWAKWCQLGVVYTDPSLNDQERAGRPLTRRMCRPS